MTEDWPSRLSAALEERGEERIEFDYQPFSLLFGEPRWTQAGELLARLEGPQGRVPAGVWIEELGECPELLIALDEKAMKQALQALDSGLALAVNLSSPTLSQKCGNEWILSILGGNIVRHDLILEVTELQQVHLVMGRLLVRAAHERGCLCALDDFGAGFSCFDLFRILSADVLKIDGSLVSRVPLEPRCGIIVEALLYLGTLGRCTLIAEFVESEAIAQFLKDAAERVQKSLALPVVLYGQGFGLELPVPFDCAS